MAYEEEDEHQPEHETENIPTSADSETDRCVQTMFIISDGCTQTNLIWKPFTRKAITSTMTLQPIIRKLTKTSVLRQAENFESDICIPPILSTITHSTSTFAKSKALKSCRGLFMFGSKDWRSLYFRKNLMTFLYNIDLENRNNIEINNPAEIDAVCK